MNLQGADYVEEPLEMGYSRSLWRQYSAPDTNPDYWVALYCNAEGQIVEMENSISQQQLFAQCRAELDRTASAAAGQCLFDRLGRRSGGTFALGAAMVQPFTPRSWLTRNTAGQPPVEKQTTIMTLSLTVNTAM